MLQGNHAADERSFSLFMHHSSNEFKDPGHYHQGATHDKETTSHCAAPDGSTQNHSWWPTSKMTPSGRSAGTHTCAVPSHEAPMWLVCPTAHSRDDSVSPPALGYNRLRLPTGALCPSMSLVLGWHAWGEASCLPGNCPMKLLSWQQRKALLRSVARKELRPSVQEPGGTESSAKKHV